MSTTIAQLALLAGAVENELDVLEVRGCPKCRISSRQHSAGSVFGEGASRAATLQLVELGLPLLVRTRLREAQGTQAVLGNPQVGAQVLWLV